MVYEMVLPQGTAQQICICGMNEQAGPAGKDKLVLSLLGTPSLLGPCLLFPSSVGFKWTSEGAGMWWAHPHLSTSRRRGCVWHGSCVCSSLPTCSTLSILSILFSFLCESHGVHSSQLRPPQKPDHQGHYESICPLRLFAQKRVLLGTKNQKRVEMGMSV